MKYIVTFLLAILLVASNGCITSVTVYHAKGYTRDRVEVSKGDKLIPHNGRLYVLQHPEGEESSQLKLPDNMPPNPQNYAFYAYRPHPAYYALLPLTVPADTVTLPIQALAVVAFLIWWPGHT